MAFRDGKVSVSCLCGQVAQEVHLNTAATSTAILVCHCTICRATSGLLFVSYLPLVEPPDLSADLRRYEQADNVSRWFCSRCGAHVFGQDHHNNEYYLALGLVDVDTDRPIKHYGVADTRDGGLGTCLSGDHANEPPCLFGASHVPQQSNAILATSNSNIGTLQDRLNASCHCGGISFYITRPDASSAQVSSPWPDLLVPYHSHSSDNPEDVKWWLRAEKMKYLAGTCACRSCRLFSGFPVQTWTFVPKSNIFQKDGSPLSFNTGTMQQYESQPGIFREFCRTCGATIFWHCLERPGVIDVSVGLLKSPVGARAEDWLEWATDRISFVEDAIHKPLIDDLDRGLKQLK
jgi:hypothetical protein